MKLNRPRYIKEILDSGQYDRLISQDHGRAVALLSGGIDSTVAMMLAKQSGLEVVGLEFFYQGRPSNETTNVEKICELTNTGLYRVNYPEPIKRNNFNGTNAEKIEVSESNVLYYSIAAGFAHEKSLDYIIGGQILNDWFNTKSARSTPEHYENLNEILKREYAPNYPSIIMPLIYLNKVEVVRIGKHLKAPLKLTWSCPRSNEIPCMECAQCREREEAFRIVYGEE